MNKETSTQFEEVVLCHLDLVYRMAHSLSGDVHDAEDLVQETFLRAYQAFHRFDVRAQGAKPWLLKILHNAFFTRRGQAKSRQSLLEDVSFGEIAEELEREDLPRLDADAVDWEYFDQELKWGVKSLSPEHRAVILLWSFGDLSYPEIAVVLNCTVGTVMSRLYRARQLLNKGLAEYARQRGILPSREMRP